MYQHADVCFGSSFCLRLASGLSGGGGGDVHISVGGSATGVLTARGISTGGDVLCVRCGDAPPALGCVCGAAGCAKEPEEDAEAGMRAAEAEAETESAPLLEREELSGEPGGEAAARRRWRRRRAPANHALSRTWSSVRRARGSVASMAVMRARNSALPRSFGKVNFDPLILSAISEPLFPSKGSTAHTRAYRTTPRAQISAAGEQSRIVNISGAW